MDFRASRSDLESFWSVASMAEILDFGQAKGQVEGNHYFNSNQGLSMAR
jgi:hypothetical protein